MNSSLVRKWTLLAFLLGAAVLFYFENRAAYKGYFSDDDLINTGWPTFVGNDTFYNGLLRPKFDPSNFRPVGFFYYRLMGRTFKLNYPPYVVVIQVVHVLNAIILFSLLRRLNFTQVAAVAGALFYAFHAAVMEAYWKPMYVFDLLCATLCLVTLLLYVRGRWILAMLTFWLAYKSKEIAVMLPVALLTYEFLLGRRNWKRLVPFFEISLSFGLQALWQNTHLPPINPYSLHFTPLLLWKTIAFYSSAILFLPFAGLALLALPIFVRDRRLYLGLLMMVSMLAPLILLSNRYASVYWYVPLIGLAIAAAAIASRVPRWTVALFFVLWLPLNYLMLRTTRSAILVQAGEVRSYVSGLLDYARQIPPVKAVVFTSTPPHMEPWGVEGANHHAFGMFVDVEWYRDPKAAQAMAKIPMAIVAYYPLPRIVKGMLRTRNELQSEIDFKDLAPESQFGDGWLRVGVTNPVRWTSAKANVTLYRPAGSQEFEISCTGPSNVTVLEDGQPLARSSAHSLRWKLPPSAAGNKRITILSEGIAIKSLGYVAP